MKIGAFSDTHTMHGQIDKKELEQYDVLVFAGDGSNVRSPAMNANEVADFAIFYNSVDVKYKIWIGGNHDTSIEAGLIRPKEICPTAIYLQDSSVEVEGVVFFGSPYTPTFGDWAFMKARHKMDRVWNSLPSGIDVLITHGPPKGVLDLTENREGEYEMCGDKSLLNWVLKNKPKVHIFGHIHDCKTIRNQGILIRDGITFANVSCVRDGDFGSGLITKVKTIHI